MGGVKAESRFCDACALGRDVDLKRWAYSEHRFNAVHAWEVDGVNLNMDACFKK